MMSVPPPGAKPTSMVTGRVGSQRGWAAAALFVGVWPGNVTMAWRARRGSPVRRVVTLVRLPLQVPLIATALRIARAG